MSVSESVVAGGEGQSMSYKFRCVKDSFYNARDESTCVEASFSQVLRDRNVLVKQHIFV